MNYEPLPDELERIGKEIVDSAYRVHQELGPGLLESVYEECMVSHLRKNGLKVEVQDCLPVEFDGQVLQQNKVRIDMVVEDKVVVENKAVSEMNPLFETQTLNYLRLGEMRLGYLINYNVTLIKNGIKRFVI
ncbi:GxxExxY protein [Pontiella sp.]|uniref:GxxExxY protein n=1 Tax=Pontiella sp. TaxID=2837462 RepID=UPI00356172C9